MRVACVGGVRPENRRPVLRRGLHTRDGEGRQAASGADKWRGSRPHTALHRGPQAGQGKPRLSLPQQPRAEADACDDFHDNKRGRKACRNNQEGESALAATLICHASAGRRCEHTTGAGAARPREHTHDRDIYAHQPQASAKHHRGASAHTPIGRYTHKYLRPFGLFLPSLSLLLRLRNSDPHNYLNKNSIL